MGSLSKFKGKVGKKKHRKIAQGQVKNPGERLKQSLSSFFAGKTGGEKGRRESKETWKGAGVALSGDKRRGRHRRKEKGKERGSG